MHHSALPAASISHPILPLLHHPISSLLTYSLISLTLHIKQSHQTLSLHPLIPLNSFYLPLSLSPLISQQSHINLSSYSLITLTPLSYSTLSFCPLSQSHSLTPLSISQPTLPFSHSTLPHPTHSFSQLSHTTLALSPPFTPLPQLLHYTPSYPTLPLATYSHSSSHLTPLFPHSLTPLFYSTLPLAPHSHCTLLLSPYSFSSLSLSFLSPPYSTPPLSLHSPLLSPLSSHSLTPISLSHLPSHLSVNSCHSLTPISLSYPLSSFYPTPLYSLLLSPNSHSTFSLIFSLTLLSP